MLLHGAPLCRIFSEVLDCIQKKLETLDNPNDLIILTLALVRLLRIKDMENLRFLIVKSIGKLVRFLEGSYSNLKLDYLVELFLEVNDIMPTEELKKQTEAIISSLIKSEDLYSKAIGYYALSKLTRNADAIDKLRELYNLTSNDYELNSKICALIYITDVALDDEIKEVIEKKRDNFWEYGFYSPKLFPTEEETIVKIFKSHKELSDSYDVLILSSWLEGIIKNKLVSYFFKPASFKPLTIKVDLNPLVDEFVDGIIIGRGKGDHEKYGCNGLMYIGRALETGDYYGKKILLDAVESHRIFICGRTGSGKSYTMGVIIEELILSNLDVGIVIIDPTGMFYDIGKEPSDESQRKMLESWGLAPVAYPNVKVFVPIEIYDRLLPEFKRNSVPFAIKPSELTVDDWCNTFGVDPIKSTQSALLRTILDLIKKGYETVDGKFIDPNPEDYSIDDMIFCLTHAKKVVGKESLFKKDSIRALHYRLEDAKRWGVFSEKGTLISEISKSNQISVIDLSFIETDSVRSLVTGLIARKIFESRYSTVAGTKTGEMAEEIPITWLFIDEAHNFASARRITPATEPLIKYAIEGRKYGCSLVLVTQRPSATHDTILSQIDIMITHSLSLKLDINAFKARCPSYIPDEIEIDDILATLPPGVAVIASQRQNRIFFAQIRPRMTEHAGRTIKPSIRIKPQEIERLELPEPEKRIEKTEPLLPEKEELEIEEEIQKKEEIIYEHPEEIEEEVSELDLTAIPPPLTLNIAPDILADFVLRLMIVKLKDDIFSRPYIKKAKFVSEKYFMPMVKAFTEVLSEYQFKLDDTFRLGDATVIKFSKDDSVIILLGIIASKYGKNAFGIIISGNTKETIPIEKLIQKVERLADKYIE
ncbi:MAG: ATP-binding protein [Candidatus Asgardarchaeum sp.]